MEYPLCELCGRNHPPHIIIQGQNTRQRRNDVRFAGETAYKASLRLSSGTNGSIVHHRLMLGWSKLDAFTLPISTKKYGGIRNNKNRKY